VGKASDVAVLSLLRHRKRGGKKKQTILKILPLCLSLLTNQPNEEKDYLV